LRAKKKQKKSLSPHLFVVLNTSCGNDSQSSVRMEEGETLWSGDREKHVRLKKCRTRFFILLAYSCVGCFGSLVDFSPSIQVAVERWFKK
jgi:hypothetical protein